MKIKISRSVRSIAKLGYNAINKVKRTLWGINFAKSSYSQFGEDMILRAIFVRYPKKYRGFYIDIGANHPIKYSNSYYFYKLGWQGICIDPVPNGLKLFSNKRKKDLFLEVGVSEIEGELNYYMYKEPAYNTFSMESTKELPFKWLQSKQVKTIPLRKIFENNLKVNQVIDFLSIDAEGMDFEVLRSNNWILYRPKIVITELMDEVSIEKKLELPLIAFMNKQGYATLAIIPSVIYFIDKNSSCFDGGSFLNLT